MKKMNELFFLHKTFKADITKRQCKNTKVVNITTVKGISFLRQM